MANKIITKNSNTTTVAPGAGSLLQGELAVNIPDGKLWVGDAAGDPTAMVEPLFTAPVSYTVGTGKDFENINEVNAWLKTAKAVNADVTFVLDDGVHKVYVDDGHSLVIPRAARLVVIKSASGNKALCSLTIDGTSTYNGFTAVVSNYGNLIVDKITIDPELDAYADGGNANGIICISNTGLKLLSCSILNGRINLNCNHGTHVECFNTVFDGAAVLNIGVYDAVLKAGCQVNNGSIGIYVDTSIGIGQISIGDTTFSGNTTDTYIPLNEVQDDGSYIADGTGLIYGTGTTF